MNDKLLITVQDIRTYRPTAELDAERVEPFIREVQVHNLKAIINDVLYYDFMLKIDDSIQPEYAAYQKLLNGTTYTVGGNTIYFDGLKPYLSYMTLEHFCRENPLHITKYGIVKKANAQSEAATTEEIKVMLSNLRDCAASCQRDIIKYLDNTYTAGYPLYRVNRSNNTVKGTGVRMYKL